MESHWQESKFIFVEDIKTTLYNFITNRLNSLRFYVYDVQPFLLLAVISESVEMIEMLHDFLPFGYTARGTKMFYDRDSSSMDYSNRMTVLHGICFPGEVQQ